MIRSILFSSCMVSALFVTTLSEAQDADYSDQDGVVQVSSTDLKVAAAKTEALKSLPAILAKVDKPPKGWSDISFKVDFPVGDNGSEFMWVAYLERKDGAFKGVLSNDPQYVDYAAFGDVVQFERDQIIDWQYSKDGKLHGHYTTRAILDNMDAATQIQILAMLSETPE